MFSSIASFLPSALNLHTSHDLPRPTINPEDAVTEDEDEQNNPEQKPCEDSNLTDREQPKSRKEREKDKDKLANETFIFVRPPPSKTNHPLNLQVQLVPPNAKPPSGVVPNSRHNETSPVSSGTSEFGESDTPVSAGSMNSMSSQGSNLQRSASTKSRDRHSASANNRPEAPTRIGTHSRNNSAGTSNSEGLTNATSSTASFASFASAASNTSTNSAHSSSSGRRTIIPLYNLQAHNVLTNVIVDAGNDAKIAKFQKRGIEVIDVALMEPVEVWGEKDRGLGSGGGTSSFTIQGTGNGGGSAMKEAQRESARLSVDELGAMMGNFSILGPKEASTKEKSGSGLLSARSIGGFFQSGSQQNGSRPPTPSAASSATSLHSTSQYAPSAVQHRLSNSFTPDSAAHMASPSGSPRKLNHPYHQHESPISISAPPKRNIFNKLFSKRNGTSTPPPPPPSVILVQPATPDPNSTPTPERITNAGRGVASQQTATSRTSEKSKGNRTRFMPPPLTGLGTTPGQESNTRMSSKSSRQLLSPPDSAATTRPPSQSPLAGSEQVTPTATPRLATSEEVEARFAKEDGPATPTNATPPALPEKRGHGRNLSLTSAITSPLKATLNKNKNRFSAVVSNVVGGSSGASLSPNEPVVEEASRNGSLREQVSVKDFAPMTAEQERESSQDSRTSKSPTRTPLKKPSMTDRVLAQNNREVSPNPSVARSTKSRRSLVGSQTNESSESGNGSVPHYQAHPAQQPPLMMPDPTVALSNARQQQLQLRPPVLGIQPTFVSASSPVSNGVASGSGLLSSGYSSNNATTSSMGLASPLGSARGRGSAENPESVLQGQRALMYVWLVRRWLKKHQSLGNGASGGGSLAADAAGFFSSLSLSKTGGKTKEKGKEKEALVAHPGHIHSPPYGIHGVSEGTGGPPPLPYGGVEVRFEWKRAKAKDKGKGKKDRRSRNVTNQRSRGGGSDNEMERSASVRDRDRSRGGEESKDAKERVKAAEKKKHRMSTGSISTTTQGSDEADGPGGFGLKRKGTSTAIDDEDDDSDPEDSETPWVCTLKVRRSVLQTSAATGVSSITNSMLMPLGAAPPGSSGASPTVVQLHPQVLRVKVGTLSPTPHHPKVVAMLKVPYPLPDVEIERMGIVKRKGFPGAQPGDNEEEEPESQEPYDGLTLTAEEIKDIVCSTGLWLVVREGFGGVGRVSRKGDGWRIRA
ncbi:hypothetical protein CVT24_004979 [Panaeolus cyanescens]|uniref:Uncharacterized protein n=1 Tax=Panaeolus cyanescens TaxID=181874 RepID=A0A409VEG0_9AGAR|nr:hypothetical protein CVT24_004979 [Panaeolus cyanescens]